MKSASLIGLQRVKIALCVEKKTNEVYQYKLLKWEDWITCKNERSNEQWFIIVLL